MKTYKIPLYNLAVFEEKFAKIAKRSLKTKSPISYKVLGVEEVEKFELLSEDAKKEVMEAHPEVRAKFMVKVSVAVVEVSGEAPKMQGYEFLGKVEHTTAGNIVSCPVDESVAPQLFHSKQECVHCGTSRYRKFTYVIRKEGESNVFLVGKNCLKDFLGHSSPEQIAEMTAMLRDLSEITELSRGGREYSGEATHYSFREVLAETALFVLKYGYKKFGDDATSWQVKENLSRPRWVGQGKDRELLEREPMTESALKLAEQAYEWLQEQFQAENLNGYMNNLKVVSALEYFEYNKLNLVISALPSYTKAVELDLRRKYEKQERAKSTFQGEVGKRMDFEGIRVVRSFSHESMYGMSYFYIMNDSKGNMYTWSSSRPVLNEGKTYKLKATVKAHEMYNEAQQTKITRAKVLEVKSDEEKREETLNNALAEQEAREAQLGE